MNRSIILSTAIRYLLPLMLMFSVYVLFRGHNEPGGGFLGGLLAAAAFALHGIAEGTERAREMLRAEPAQIVFAGLTLALASALIAPLFTGQPFMTALWGTQELPAIGKLGTPLLFDIGVYLTVLGVIAQIVFSLAEEE